MKIARLIAPLALVFVFACGDDNGQTPFDDDPYQSDPNDPVICVGDPDTSIVCKKQSDFWDCTAMPNGDKKCAHNEDIVPPGGGSWTCQELENKIVCDSDKKDAVPGGSGEWTCKNNSSGGTTCEKQAPVPPGGGTWSCGYDSEFNWTCTKKGGSGTTPPPPPPPPTPPMSVGDKICFDPVNKAGLPTPPEGYWAQITAKKVLYKGTEALYVRVAFSKAFVDNTYGANTSCYADKKGGCKGHSFKDLVGSDKAEVFFNNADGDLLMHMAVDYISESKTHKSGYGCLGVNGGDGKMIKGNASDVLAAQSSLSVNFNQYDYVLTTDSPATDKNYKPNAKYPKWIFTAWTEVWVKWSVFGKIGPGKVYITGIHASPSKLGEHTLKVLPVPCP